MLGKEVTFRSKDYKGTLRLERELGSGAHSTVYAARNISTGSKYAVKVLNTNASPTWPEQELKLHQRVDSYSGVLRCYRWLKSSSGNVYIQLELCSGGDMYDAIHEGLYMPPRDCSSRERRTMLKAWSAFRKLVSAVNHCHELKVFHRDIKPGNILLDGKEMKVKLADFGYATTHQSSTSAVGTDPYMSPETYHAFYCTDRNCPDMRHGQHKLNTAAQDVWSVGVTALELFTGEQWWATPSFRDSGYRQFVTNPEYFILGELKFSEIVGRILIRMLEPEPNARITIKDVRKAVSAYESIEVFTR